MFIHLQSKALRERWLLDGAPAEEETQKRLQEDEVKTKLLEQVILRLATKPASPSVGISHLTEADGRSCVAIPVSILVTLTISILKCFH